MRKVPFFKYSRPDENKYIGEYTCPVCGITNKIHMESLMGHMYMQGDKYFEIKTSVLHCKVECIRDEPFLVMYKSPLQALAERIKNETMHKR